MLENIIFLIVAGYILDMAIGVLDSFFGWSRNNRRWRR